MKTSNAIMANPENRSEEPKTMRERITDFFRVNKKRVGKQLERIRKGFDWRFFLGGIAVGLGAVGLGYYFQTDDFKEMVGSWMPDDLKETWAAAMTGGVDTTPDTPPVTPPETAPTPTPEAPKAPDGQQYTMESDRTDTVAEQTYVTKDRYAMSVMTLEGIDTDGDGVPDTGGIADRTGPLENPTEEEMANFQDSIEVGNTERDGITLSKDEARAALEDGGFVKDGKTYEIWQSREDPSSYIITEVPQDHPLAGNVVNLDTAGLHEQDVPVELADEHAEGYERYQSAADAEIGFEGSPEQYQAALDARDAIFTDEEGARAATNIIGAFTPEQIMNDAPPANAGPRITEAWNDMQDFLRDQHENLPLPKEDEGLLPYLIRVGIVK